MVRFRAVVAALVVCGALGLIGCSDSEDLGIVADTTTSKPVGTLDPLDERAKLSGAKALEKLNTVIDKLVAETDFCAAFSGKDVNTSDLDAQLFTNATARKALSAGLVRVYDHLVEIGPLELHDPLVVQRDAYVAVLAVLDQYSVDPGNADASTKMNELTQTPEFIKAQQLINNWMSANCA